MSSRSRRSSDPDPNPATSVSPRSFHVESLGCAKNQVDSELMIAALEADGWTLAPDAEHAEVLIVNTCGFISDAKRESIETTLELKARYPRRKVLMVGCLPERYAEALGTELTEVDGFLGNRDPAAIRGLVAGLGESKPTAAKQPPTEPVATRQSFERSHLLSYPGSAYVKVAEGCDNRCTYCAIPLIRGGLRSRHARRGGGGDPRTGGPGHPGGDPHRPGPRFLRTGPRLRGAPRAAAGDPRAGRGLLGASPVHPSRSFPAGPPGPGAERRAAAPILRPAVSARLPGHPRGPWDADRTPGPTWT